MSNVSKTARASMVSGPVGVKKDPFDTPEKKIQELRNQRRDKLAVNRYDFIDALIEAYDKLALDLLVVKAKLDQAADTEERLRVELIQTEANLSKKWLEAKATEEKLRQEFENAKITRDELRAKMEAAAVDQKSLKQE
jgi:hypothetical protein